MTYNLVIAKAPIYHLVINPKTGLNLRIEKRNPINIVIQSGNNGIYQRKIFVGDTPPPAGMLEENDFWYDTSNT